MSIRMIAAGLFAVFVPPAVAEDFTIVSKTRFGEKQGTQTVCLTPARMKTSGGGSDSIVEFASGQMTFLDGEKKTYYVTSMAEMTAYARHREEQAGTSGFNAREFGGLGEVAARKTGKTRQIAGTACTEWVFTMGEALGFEVCVAPTLPVPPAYFDARKAAYAGMGPMGRHFEKMFEAVRKASGFPLALAMHVKMESMKQESLTEASEVKRGAIPAATFEVPADFTKKKSPFAPG
ncbi:MAG: DUF4412 domain-containing protein [Thermoanaerobaculia bacterium]